MNRTGHNTEIRELTESELNGVSGGSDPQIAWSKCLNAAGFPTNSYTLDEAKATWNQLLGQNGY